MPVAETSCKRAFLACREKVDDRREARHFKLLRVARNHFPVNRHEEVLRGEQDWTTWQLHPAILLQPHDILARQRRVADGPRGQVHHLVTVLRNGRVERGDAVVSPVAPNEVGSVPKQVRPRDGPVDVRNHHLVVVVPQEDVALNR